MTQQPATKSSLKPLGNRVLAKRTEKESNLKGSIILPDSAQQKQETARVIAIGTGKKTSEGKEIPIPVKVGDVILIDKYAGQEISIDDEDLLIFRADDIIAIVQ
jgi:chaperonin GroES